MTFQVIPAQSYIDQQPPPDQLGTALSNILMRVFQMQTQRRAEDRLKLETMSTMIKAAADQRAEERLQRGQAQGVLDKGRTASEDTLKALSGQSVVPFLKAAQAPTATSLGVPEIGPGEAGPPTSAIHVGAQPDKPTVITNLKALGLGDDVAGPLADAISGMSPEQIQAGQGPPVAGAQPRISHVYLPPNVDQHTGARVPGQAVPLRFSEDAAATRLREEADKVRLAGGEERAKKEAEIAAGPMPKLSEIESKTNPPDMLLGTTIPPTVTTRSFVAPKKAAQPVVADTQPITATGVTAAPAGTPTSSEAPAVTAPPAAPKPGGATGKQPLSGQALLESLPPVAQEHIKGILDYSLDLKDIGLRGGQQARFGLESAARRVAQGPGQLHDPDWTAGNYAQRQKFMQDFNTGPDSKVMKSLNQLSSHAALLGELFEAEKNPTDVAAINAVVNKIKEFTGHPEVNNAKLARLAVASEVSTLMKGGVAEQGLEQAWQGVLSTNAAPEVQQQALQTVRSIMHGRFVAQRQQWEAVMGNDRLFLKRLTPDALNVLGVKQGATSAAPAAPSVSEQEFLARHKE